MVFGKSTPSEVETELIGEITPSNSGSITTSSEKPVQILHGAIVCVPLEDIIACPNSGPIFIGENTIIHPKVILESGPNSGGIYIGKNNIIEEKVKITNYTKQQLVIGDFNWIQSSSIIDSQMIGHRNVIEPRVVLERASEIENDCHIGGNCRVRSYQCIPNNTSVLGSNCQQLTMDPNEEHTKMVKLRHLDMMVSQYKVLSKILYPLNNKRKGSIILTTGIL